MNEYSAEEACAGYIGYEFEVETETRYAIEPGNMSDYRWVNHVVDTYDKTGRIRIRVKNGEPRLSIKVPLFTRDTETSKTCLRLEFKTTNESQKQSLFCIRELILQEDGTQIVEKWGAEITMTTGEGAWINRNDKGEWWIEIDSGCSFCPPENINVLGIGKKHGQS